MIMITEKQYLKALAIVKAYQKQINDQVNNIIEADKQSLPLEEVTLSVRAFNAIKGFAGWQGIKIDTVADIAKIEKTTFLKSKYAGVKTVAEVESYLKSVGLNFADGKA